MLLENNVKTVFENGVLTAFVIGDVDHHNAKLARFEIDRCLEEMRPKKMILDLSAVSFMDSSGLGLILGRYSKAKELGSEFAVANPNEASLKIIKLAGGERIINIISRSGDTED